MSLHNLITPLVSKRSRISQASASQTSMEADTLELVVFWELWETHTIAPEVRKALETWRVLIERLNRSYLLSPSRQSRSHLHWVAVPKPFSSSEWSWWSSGSFWLQRRQCDLGLRDQSWKARRKYHIEASFEHTRWHFLLRVSESGLVIRGRGCFSVHTFVQLSRYYNSIDMIHIPVQVESKEVLGWWLKDLSMLIRVFLCIRNREGPKRSKKFEWFGILESEHSFFNTEWQYPIHSRSATFKWVYLNLKTAFLPTILNTRRLAYIQFRYVLPLFPCLSVLHPILTLSRTKCCKGRLIMYSCRAPFTFTLEIVVKKTLILLQKSLDRRLQNLFFGESGEGSLWLGWKSLPTRADRNVLGYANPSIGSMMYCGTESSKPRGANWTECRMGCWLFGNLIAGVFW